MRLAREGRIILDLEETSHVTMQEVDESDSEMNLTEVPKALGKCFPKSFFDCVAIYTTLCSEYDDDLMNN